MKERILNLGKALFCKGALRDEDSDRADRSVEPEQRALAVELELPVIDW